MSAETPPDDIPFTQRRDFWLLIGYALVLGVFGGAFGLLFMGLIGVGDNWFSTSNDGWMGGNWWWVGVTAAAGVVVGLLRMATHLPEQTPGLMADLEEESVDPRLVTGIVVVSAASLIGGASLGPEKPLGAAGGGVGRWLSRRAGMDLEDRQVTTMSGFAAAFGGVFSSTVLAIMLIIEIVRPTGRKFTKVLVTTVVSSSLSFGIYFAIAGSVFLDAYPVPAYQFEDWHLLAGVALGLVAAVLVTLLVVLIKEAMQLFDRIKAPSLVKSTIGGAIFGVIGVALPLTMFTGSAELGVVLKSGATLGLGLVILLVIGKMITFAVSLASGFVGGPIFPSLFIGGSAGVALNLAFPDLPLGLTFTCMLAAVPGAVVAAPFTFVLLAAFMTQVGPLNTAPVLIAVITSFIAIEAVKYVVAGRQREKAAANRTPAPAT
jgi:H+/Cl- antiporter ClcA